VHAALLGRRRRRFERAARDPARAQAERLRVILSHAAGSAFAREHELGCELDDLRRLPIQTYADLEPWLTRIAAGESNVLTRARLLALERSSGSTAATKLLPITDAFLTEIGAATNVWLSDLYATHSELFGTTSYWSVSPVTHLPERTKAGVTIGMEDDTAYFDPVTRWALRRMLAVPPAVARIPNVDTWRRRTAEGLVAAADLGLISVWSPTFLLSLLRFIEETLDDLLASVSARRSAAVSARLDHGARLGDALWPRVNVISCWTDGPSASFLPLLDRYFATPPIQPKGLLATEGVVSFPVHGEAGAVLAVDSHFLELIDVEHPEREPLLAHELRPGAEYSPVLTTSAGLIRYHLQDVVRCVGRFHSTPTVRFVGKLDRTSDLCGEKLSGPLVERALADVRRGLHLTFVMVAPVDADPPHYALFVECDAADAELERAAAAVEDGLLRVHHYRYCRDLGQLGPLRAVRVQHAWEIYQETLAARGQRLGDIKPSALDAEVGWAERFSSAR